MKISYLIFTHDETDTLLSLLFKITTVKDNEDEIIIADDYSTNEQTLEILDSFADKINVVKYKLENGYDEKKNKALKHCSKDYIFAIDGDEVPTDDLITNIKPIIDVNPDIECFWIPRINLFSGVTEQDAKKWGWRLSMSKTYNKPIVNAYDPQGRLFKNKQEIKWVGRLHEHLKGNKNYTFIPDNDETLALVHIKSIEKQLETNLRYNKEFTEQENKGFNIPK